MQSHPPANVYPKFSGHLNPFEQIGEPPDPVIWVHENRLEIEFELYDIVDVPLNGNVYKYQFKEIDGEWWKLEWPD